MTPAIYRFILSPTRTLFRTIFKPKTKGVKILIRFQNEYLLIKNSYGKTNLWTLPGGGAKKNENQASAAKREVKEELGIKLKDLKKIDYFLNEDEPNKDMITLFISKVENKNFIVDKKEIKEASWFSKKELVNLEHKSKTLERVISKVVLKNS